MSRSAADATRFTATGPYASSKPGAPYDLPESLKSKDNATQPKQAQPLGPGGMPETPKQKVERLRAQARAARMAQSSSGVDRFIEYGRRFANKAHKGMVYSLIAASGVCGVLTVYSMVSLTMYNRRQRTLWIEKEMETLKQARIAQANGTANAEQLELVKKEEIEAIYAKKREEEKAQRPWAKAKQFLFGQMNVEDTAAPAAQTTAASSVESAESSIIEAANVKKAFADAAVPGQLDVIAENAERATKEKTKGWVSWMTGR
ncbi:uncharacterized protein N7484_001976 [Penicillium longicatenatum]|uniref:uncharacterized protein n=1 Tax=Penicillium longicatenatum TaxID=1561947 RepID=UPI0025485B67|nr:uncharacterized protein N7484_001976 [Penicillium longicatenatum]KAJ5658327.1 hypothetical protein N7484_001976 [Penicillium longicatenatum]